MSDNKIENLDNNENNQPQIETPTEEISLGQKMRETREKQGYSLGDVAERLKLSAKQVESLENNEFEALPGVVFIRGFYRSYAKLLKLSDEQITADLNKYLPTNDQIYVKKLADSGSAETFAPMKVQETTPSSGGIKWLVSGVLLVAVCVGGYYLFANKNDAQIENETVATQASAEEPLTVTPNFSGSEQTSASNVAIATPTEAASAESTANMPISKNLVIVVGYKTYLTVTDAKGTVWNNSGKTVAANSSHEFPAENAPYSIRIGFAKNSKVSFAGKEIETSSKIKSKTLEMTIPLTEAANNGQN